MKRCFMNNADGTFGIFRDFQKFTIIIIPNGCNRLKCSNRSNIHFKTSLAHFETYG